LTVIRQPQRKNSMRSDEDDPYLEFLRATTDRSPRSTLAERQRLYKARMAVDPRDPRYVEAVIRAARAG
jgi:hypothetical protein